MDLFELNEAFAAQSLAVIKELGLDKSKVDNLILLLAYLINYLFI